ncbi:hypothetical protein LO763_19575 [Glycomyces sp. A-F 0318]|uniref:hypothetical protein n=1 Tax=Glycomyces amatae TaxID=2881355 RepID=UPI001E53E68B|nr:hypothetical protein [Glycomyces amatae]MCD0445812.1 hypothetical protein [Glycomyces amatae]
MTALIPTTVDDLERLQCLLLAHTARLAPWPIHTAAVTGPTMVAWHAAQGTVRLWLADRAATTDPEHAWIGPLHAAACEHYIAAGLIAYTAANVSAAAADTLAARSYKTAADTDPAVPMLDALTGLAGDVVAEQAASRLAANFDNGTWKTALVQLAAAYDVAPAYALAATAIEPHTGAVAMPDVDDAPVKAPKIAPGILV